MPYDRLAELPDHVKKLSKKKQRQWKAAFNAAFAKHGEASAFRIANAAIKEAINKMEEKDMKKSGIRDIDFTSDLSEAIGAADVNTESGVIGGVVILTGNKVSKNKTLYTDKAIQEARTRYEGAKMYLDHPSPDSGPVRSVRDLGGTYKNLRIEEGNFLKADLHLLPSKKIRDLVLPIAESKPIGVGLSIRDRGQGREHEGVFMVESFVGKNNFSIDLVTEASVNENLFEATNQEDEMKIEDIKLEDLQEGNPALVDAIKSTERQAVLQEFSEKIKKGEEAEKVILSSRKVALLAEAGFRKEIAEKVKFLVEPEAISLEMAESIIKTQKEIIAGGLPAGNPKVKGHGSSKEDEVIEGHEDKEPTSDELAEAINSAV